MDKERGKSRTLHGDVLVITVTQMRFLQALLASSHSSNSCVIVD